MVPLSICCDAVQVTGSPSFYMHATWQTVPSLSCILLSPCRGAVIIPTVAPTASCASETASTLKFAQRAKQIKNQPIVNEDVSQSAVEMAAELQRLRHEVAMLRSLQASAGSSSGTAGGLEAVLEANAQLEARSQHLQEQLARLRQ